MSDTLHLNLIRKWFDMIESGEKLTEYREITHKKEGEIIFKQWCVSRFCTHERFYADSPNAGMLLGGQFQKWVDKAYSDLGDSYWWSPKQYKTVTFRNGMTRPIPELVCDFGGISIGTGNPEWGAVPGKEYFCIHISNPRRTR